MNTPIYLDYAATTPVDPRVAEKMLRYAAQDEDIVDELRKAHPGR